MNEPMPAGWLEGGGGDGGGWVCERKHAVDYAWSDVEGRERRTGVAEGSQAQ